MEFKQVQELPLGEYVKRKEDSAKVYRRGPYDRQDEIRLAAARAVLTERRKGKK